jgi:hypothetical protein
VIVDACRDQRVCELKQDRARPPEQDEPFGIEALRDYERSFSARPPPALSAAPPAVALAEADASADADFHSHPATPTSAKPIAPWRTSFQLRPFGWCAGSSSER